MVELCVQQRAAHLAASCGYAIRQCGEPSRMAQNWFYASGDWKARSHGASSGNAGIVPPVVVWPPTSSFGHASGTRRIRATKQSETTLRCDPSAKGEYKYIGHVRSLYPNVRMARAGGAIPANRSVPPSNLSPRATTSVRRRLSTRRLSVMASVCWSKCGGLGAQLVEYTA